MVSVLQNTRGEGEGTFRGGKQCEVEMSGFFQKIREKRCLFQRFVTSIVALLDKINICRLVLTRNTPLGLTAEYPATSTALLLVAAVLTPYLVCGN